MWSRAALLLTTGLLALPALALNGPGSQIVDIGVGCSHSAYPGDAPVAGPGAPTFSYVAENPLANFISVHFSYLHLPMGDYVVVRPTLPGGNETRQLTIQSDTALTGPFFSDELLTTSVTIELYSTTNGVVSSDPNVCFGFSIDEYRYAAATDSEKEMVCGADDSLKAACTKMYPDVFKRASAVGRLTIRQANATLFCTGWLVGCEGHVLTNHHCISTPDDAKNTKFEFQALGQSCDDNCDKPFGCQGKVRGSSAQLIVANPDLDYALVKLDDNASGDYGYLQMRESGAVVGERVYVAQHPSGWGMRIAMKTDSGWGKIESLTLGGCMANQVSYSLDTQGGSSGSPVLSWSDNTVVALHHCGGCPNTAVNARDIIADLRAKGVLPQCASV